MTLTIQNLFRTGMLFLWFSTRAGAAEPNRSIDFQSATKILNESCSECHGDGAEEGGFTLSQIDGEHSLKGRISFMFGNSVSTVSYAFLEGVKESHHETSHHQNKPEKLDQYQKISTWHVAQFAYLLNKLKGLPEGDSNVLDNSAILFGSALRDGNKHSPHDLPLLLAGRAAGRLKPGQHVRAPSDSPMANLLLTILQSVGVPKSHFADSTGPIESLLS